MARLRALLSLFMLVGFFVLFLVLLGASLALAIGLIAISPVLVKIAIPLLVAVVGGAGVATWKALSHKPEEPSGVIVTPEQSPALWHEINNLARAVGTRAPDELRIIAEVNAAVSERSRLLGLIGGRRFLYLGMPLLYALTVDQMRAVLAHELGHYSESHTRLGSIAYRGRLAIAGTISRIGKWNVAGWVFRGYGRLYLMADNAVSRRQELEADAAAVRVAGKQAAINALTEIHVINAAFDFYMGRYVAPGTEHKLLPDDIFGGFGQLLGARKDELVNVRSQVTEQTQDQGSIWDTHPPLATRIAAINVLPAAEHAGDARPAAALVSNVDGLARALQAAVVQQGQRHVLPWNDFTNALATASLQAKADEVFREIGRAISQHQIDLPTVLRQIEAGDVVKMAAPFFPNSTKRESAAQFYQPLELLLTLAAVRSGKAGWRHSWLGSPELVDISGNPLDLTEFAKLAADPQTLPQAMEKLAIYGIQVSSAQVVEAVATARGADLLGGFANISVDGADTDMLILDNGLVFIPARGGKDKGTQRLLQIVRSAPVDSLASRNRFLPYEEVASVTVTKQVPVRATLVLRNGRTVELKEAWTGEFLDKKDREMLVDSIFQAINDRA